MKHFRTLTALLLALMLLLVPLAGVLAEDEPEAEWIQIPLGTSGYSIQVPAGYTDLGVNSDDYELGAKTSFASPDTKIVIDVNQCAAQPEGFQAFAESLCAQNEGTDYAFSSDGPAAMAFYCYDMEEGSEPFHTTSLLIDAGDTYVEVNFWGPANEESDALVLKMIGTLGKTEKQYIRLGSSPYFISVPMGYYQGAVTEEEAARGMIAYYLNDALLFDFDIYENPVPEDLTLADVAMQLCAVDEGTNLQECVVNDITVYTYDGRDEYDGVEYDTVTILLDSTNGSVTAIVCWIDNETSRELVQMMLSTLSTEEQTIPDEPMTLHIGSSGWCITLPTTFIDGGVSEEEFIADGYAAAYVSPYALFDIDFYQCSIADELPTLAEFTEKDAADFNGTEIALDEEINGLPVTSYHSDEIYNGVTYHCLTYTFQDDLYYYQLCFYYIDEDAVADIEEAMGTLAPVEMTTLQVGPYVLTVPAGLNAETVDYDDVPALQACHYELSPLSFTVYEMTYDEKSMTLKEVAEAEVGYYQGSDLTFEDINGIPVAFYFYNRPDSQYETSGILTFCLETEKGYIDIDFVIDDYVGTYRALAIIHSITLAQ